MTFFLAQKEVHGDGYTNKVGGKAGSETDEDDIYTKVDDFFLIWLGRVYLFC